MTMKFIYVTQLTVNGYELGVYSLNLALLYRNMSE
jgi:hypothetical protein